MNTTLQKSINIYNSYPSKGNLFFCTSNKMEKGTLRLFISHNIVASLSKDMDRMTNLMTKSILEGMSDGRRWSERDWRSERR